MNFVRSVGRQSPLKVAEWEWVPPAAIAWGCRILLASFLMFVAWNIASSNVPHRYRNQVAFSITSITDQQKLWTAHFDAGGTITSWKPPAYVPRPNVTLTIQPVRGDARTLRVLDLIRRAEYQRADGTLVRTSDAVTISDLRDFVMSIEDDGARASLNESLPNVFSQLQACTTGTESIGKASFSHWPAAPYLASVSTVLCAGLGWLLWFTRPSKGWRITLHHPQKPNQGVEPFK